MFFKFALITILALIASVLFLIYLSIQRGRVADGIGAELSAMMINAQTTKPDPKLESVLDGITGKFKPYEGR